MLSSSVLVDSHTDVEHETCNRCALERFSTLTYFYTKIYGKYLKAQNYSRVFRRGYLCWSGLGPEYFEAECIHCYTTISNS